MADASTNSPIDALMERASGALLETRYFECAELCVEALSRARRANDFERMSRIVLPLQEARRQIRQLAIDAGTVRHVGGPEDLSGPITPGCYLFRPPLVGIDGAQLRALADERRVPVFVLVREPLTQAGQWPIAGVGRVVTRLRLDPPEPVARVEGVMAKDEWRGRVPLAWFEAAAEALGDRAIDDATAVARGDPAAYLVDDLLDRLGCAPEHEKLHQALADACRRAVREPLPERPRRRGVAPQPYSF